MGDKDDGLLLSLGLPCVPTQQQQQPNSVNNNINVQTSLKPNHLKNPWHDLFPQPEMNSDARSFLRGIDMNRVADCEDEIGVSSPNSTISSVSGKRSERETDGDETEAERASCSRGSDDEDGGGDGNRKKLRLSKEQSLILEETFKEHSTLNPKQKLALAKQLNLRPRQVEVWFQNRRARHGTLINLLGVNFGIYGMIRIGLAFSSQGLLMLSYGVQAILNVLVFNVDMFPKLR